MLSPTTYAIPSTSRYNWIFIFCFFTLAFLTPSQSNPQTPSDEQSVIETNTKGVSAGAASIAIGGDVNQSILTARPQDTELSGYRVSKANGLNVVTNVGPGSALKRLNDEGVNTDNSAQLISLKGAFSAEDIDAFRQMNTEDVRATSGSIAIGGNVSESRISVGSDSVMGFDPNVLSDHDPGWLASANPNLNPSSLTAYRANLQRSLQGDASKPGVLRIWHGQPVTGEDPYPEAILVTVRDRGGPGICSGVLIAPDFALTAAHCLCKSTPLLAIAGLGPTRSTHISQVDVPASRSLIPCEELGTDEEVLKSINKGDVAMLKLTPPMTDVPLRQIASDAKFRAAAAVRTVGFGLRDDDGVGTKFAVDIVIASYDCSDLNDSKVVPAYRCHPTHEMIAAGMGRDTCKGDSGSPAYVLGDDVKLYIAGITSRSVDPTGDCGQGGIYVRLDDPTIKDWLLNSGVSRETFAD